MVWTLPLNCLVFDIQQPRQWGSLMPNSLASRLSWIQTGLSLFNAWNRATAGGLMIILFAILELG
ncbi:MAG: hypothetical protein CL681_00510 [Blastopirellula sp.]|nr:hypothetical protein [Blastopirellula sp.]